MSICIFHFTLPLQSVFVLYWSEINLKSEKRVLWHACSWVKNCSFELFFTWTMHLEFTVSLQKTSERTSSETHLSSDLSWCSFPLYKLHITWNIHQLRLPALLLQNTSSVGSPLFQYVNACIHTVCPQATILGLKRMFRKYWKSESSYIQVCPCLLYRWSSYIWLLTFISAAIVVILQRYNYSRNFNYIYKGKFFNMRVVKHWTKLTTEVMESQTLEIIRLDWTQSPETWSKSALLWAKVGQDAFHRSLPT